MSTTVKPGKKPKRWTSASRPPSLTGERRGLVADSEIAKLLTQIVVGWPHVEDQFVSVFQRLLALSPQDFDSARLVFYSLVSQKTRIDVMRRLLERSLHNRDRGDEYDAIIDEFKKLNDLRNKYVHGLWWTHENGETHLQLDNSVFFANVEYHKITRKELQAFVDRLNVLGQQLFSL